MISPESQLAEVELRRPDFRGGEPIALEGGSTFYFPKPCVVYRPRFGTGPVSAYASTDLGPDFDAAVAELDGLGDEREDGAPPGRNTFDVLFHLAVVMLRVNYDLTEEQLGTLLCYRVDDEASQNTWGAIVDVARGNAPKLTRGTTGSPS